MAKDQNITSKSNSDMSSKHEEIDSRVGKLEGIVSTLARDIQETSRAVREQGENTNRGFKEQQQALSDFQGSMSKFKEDVLAHIGSATAPKWPLIVSSIMVVVMILGLSGSVFAVIMSGQKDAIARNSHVIEEIQTMHINTAFESGKMVGWREKMDLQVNNLHIEHEKDVDELRRLIRKDVTQQKRNLRNELFWKMGMSRMW